MKFSPIEELVLWAFARVTVGSAECIAGSYAAGNAQLPACRLPFVDILCTRPMRGEIGDRMPFSRLAFEAPGGVLYNTPANTIRLYASLRPSCCSKLGQFLRVSVVNYLLALVRHLPIRLVRALRVDTVESDELS